MMRRSTLGCSSTRRTPRHASASGLGPKCHRTSFSSRQARSQSAFGGVDTETADGTNVISKPWRGVDSLEVLYVSMPPVQLVNFLIVRAPRRSAIGDVRKVSVA